MIEILSQDKQGITERRPFQPPGPKVYRLTVNPATEPVPALKHKRVIDYLDQMPGNGVPYYYRAVLIYKDISRRYDRKLNDNYMKWKETPPSELPREEISPILRSFHRAYDNMKTAAAREKCDWDWRIRDLKGTDPYSSILEEVQESRGLARLLTLKARVEIADRRYDEAIETLRIGYKLARDVAEPPTFINAVTGMAIANMMSQQLLALIDAPGSPNMYWALTELPKPLVDLRTAMRYEKSLPVKIFHFLKDAETVERTPEEWQALLQRSFQKLASLAGEPLVSMLKSQSELALTALVLKGYPNAKQDLIGNGHTREQVEQMPVAQVVALHQAFIYRYVSDQMFKWTLLPYAEAQQGSRLQMRKLREEGCFGPAGTRGATFPIVGTLLPATRAVMTAAVRPNVRIAGLRVVEALRMHAAGNGGNWPASLDEIKVVPVPKNEATGKPFPYRVDGKTAILEIPDPGNYVEVSWRIEIVVASPMP